MKTFDEAWAKVYSNPDLMFTNLDVQYSTNDSWSEFIKDKARLFIETCAEERCVEISHVCAVMDLCFSLGVIIGMEMEK